MTLQIGPAWVGRTIARWVMEMIRAVDRDFAPLDYGPDPYDEPERRRWGAPASCPPMTALPPAAPSMTITQMCIDHCPVSPHSRFVRTQGTET